MSTLDGRVTTSAELACLDGSIGPVESVGIPIGDPALLFGDGVFEVIRIYNGSPFMLEAHFERLAGSASRALIARSRLDALLLKLRGDVQALLEARGGSSFDGALRLIVTADERRLAMTEPTPRFPDSASACFVDYEPSGVMDGIKTLSYAANMLAARVASELGYDEALLSEPDGRVFETPTASLFYVLHDGVLSTPPLTDGILGSITRAVVNDLVAVRERSVTRSELIEGCREAFIVSTTREIQPLTAIGDRQLTVPGPQTAAVRTAFGEFRLRSTQSA